jgi:ubiquinone/menaquinone biosynthesis C-methylase UbiE
MSFTAGPEAYDRFMGRYSTPLAPRFADFASIGGAQRLLDVGCGPGALTGELVRRFGAESVSAIDPAPGFVEAAADRHPGVDVRRAEAESLPFEDGSFDAALAQLVVHFMRDPAAGIGEMRRVTRHDGVVAACVWDHAGDGGPLARFWSAARELDPEAADESELPGAHEGDLERLLREAGLADVEERLLTVEVEHASFEEWWEPFTLGIGPAGAYVQGLAQDARDRLRQRCRELHPAAPFVVSASAWAARGMV